MFLRPSTQRYVTAYRSSLNILSSTHCVIFLTESPQMEMLLSTVLGEAIGRSIDFIIRKCSKTQAKDVEGRLNSVLLRAQVIIDEAKERQITNQAMLLQLEMLRGAVHQGYYMLDTFRYQSHDEDSEDQVVNQPLSLFKTYPRMYRQPYSMHLMLSNYMFDRHMETELVINFLLRPKPHHAQELEVLPIVGPRRVGKSTLVAHVCNDERIPDHFSKIIFLTEHDFRDETLSVLKQGCAMGLKNCTTTKDGRLLVIVEVAIDVTEDEWKKLCSALRRSTSNSIRIIITSRSDKITKLGTTGVITLKYLSNEAYWYFFRTLTFGSTDPKEHPRLASVAMEIAKMQNNTAFIGANITASLLRDNFDINFWCKVLAFGRGLIQKHMAKFGRHPCDLLNQNRPKLLGRMSRAYEGFMVNDHFQRSSQEAVPKITFADVFYGSVKPHENFEALLWKSRIPPYYSYIYNCQIENVKTRAAKRKRS